MLLSGNRSLPSNFAESIVDLEEKVNLNCSLEIVKDLLDLYSQAIEYYAAKHDLKHLHYQAKIQELLSRKEVAFVLKNPSLSVNQYNSAVYKRRLNGKKTRNLVDFSNKSLTDLRSADDYIQKHDHSNFQLSIQLRENLSRQNNSLINRIKKRKTLCHQRINEENEFSDESKSQGL